MNKKMLHGYAYALLYCLIFGASSVWAREFQQQRDPNLVIFFTYGIGLFIYWLCNLGSLKKLQQVACQSFSKVLVINLQTVIICAAYFWSLKFINSSLYSGIFMAALPIFGLLANLKTSFNLRTLIGALFILLFSAVVIDQQFQIQLSAPKEFVIGMGITLMGSLAAAYYFSATKALNEATGVSSLQILALRFPLITFLGLVVCWYSGSFSSLNLSDFYSLVILAMANSLCFFFIQQAILLIGPLRVSYFVPITPVINYGFELFAGQAHLDILMFFSIMALSISIIGFSFLEKK